MVKCEKTKEPIIEYGKVLDFEGYEIVLENTILFPAGGGQVRQHFLLLPAQNI